MKRRVKQILLPITALAVIAAIAWPHFWRLHAMTRNEMATINTLQMWGSMNNSLRMAGSVNQDKDNRAEWMTLGELTGQCKLRGSDQTSGFSAGGRFGVEEMTSNRWGKKNGYFFHMYFPDGKGGALSEAELSALTGAQIDARMIDEQEYHYCCYAWPVEYGKTGRKAFFMNREVWILSCVPDATIYDGTKSFPRADAAFVDNVFGQAALGKKGHDGNTWSTFGNEGGLESSNAGSILVFDKEGTLTSEVTLDHPISVQYWCGMGAESKACIAADEDGNIYAFVPGYQGALPPPHDCVYQKTRKYLIRKFGPDGKMTWEKAVDMPENVLFEGDFNLSEEAISVVVEARDSSTVEVVVDKDGQKAEILTGRKRKEKKRSPKYQLDDGVLSLSREEKGIYLVKSSSFGKEIWKRALIEFSWWQRGHGGPFGGLWMGADGKSYIHSDISHKEHLKQLESMGREI